MFNYDETLSLPTPRCPRPHHRIKSPTPRHACQCLGVAQQPPRTPKILKATPTPKIPKHPEAQSIGVQAMPKHPVLARSLRLRVKTKV
ncbi:hypothetical protein PIB30_094678 [Stylosanthes scabra]|uniref:Uncharacterized protein n=1 Tax=Stylosanthes scabra TaxID=79078 RepID=A0ABU6SVW5_9FABA|nr:hypothetical protein [Stylosanthes scabra]